METLESKATSADLHTSHYKEVNDLMYPYMEFSETGKLVSFKPEKLSDKEKLKLHFNLYKAKITRNLITLRYQQTIQKMAELDSTILEYFK